MKKDVLFNIRTSETDRKNIAKLAARFHLSKSDAIRRAIVYSLSMPNALKKTALKVKR